MSILNFRRRPKFYRHHIMLEQLEERIVLDATVDQGQQDQQAKDHPNPEQQQATTQTGDGAAAAASAASAGSEGGAAAAVASAAQASDPLGQVFHKDLNVVLISNAIAEIEAISQAADTVIATAEPHEAVDAGVNVLVISSTVQRADQLAAAAQDGVVTVQYDGVQGTPASLLAAIQSALHGQKAESIAFAAHDNGEAQFQLVGDYLVNLGSILSNPQMQSFWQGVGGLLTQNGRIDLLACRLTETDTGHLLTDQLAALTGHQVAASDDLTGSSAAGGDWVLETGGIDLVGLYFAPQAIQDYNGTLVAQTVLPNPAPANSDNFGYSVAISGNWAIVGAFRDDPVGISDAGSVYFYELSGSNWVLRDTERNPFPSANEWFGYSVAISGDWAIVGAPLEDQTPDTGFVYFYELSGSNWVLRDTEPNPGPDAFDNFGYSVAISGNWAIVGAPFDDPGGIADAGSVYFYELSGTDWVRMDTESNPFPAISDNFGYSVAVSGNWAIVGAFNDDPGGVAHAGSVYFYELSGTDWVRMDTEPNPFPGLNDGFGFSVAISGNWAIVGALSDDPGGVAHAGSVYFYELSGTDWVRMDTESNPFPAISDNFGYSVAISGNWAIVGALFDDPGGIADAGSVYLYELSGSNWSLARTESNPFPTLGENFGRSVAVSGNWAIAGAPFDDPGGIADAGSAYVFSLNEAPVLSLSHNAGSLDPTFDLDGKLTTDFGGGVDEGYAVAVQPDGKIVVAGRSNNDFAVARYNSDGTLDLTFSGDGKLTTDFAGGFDDARAVAVQSDGKIVVAGRSNNDFAIARYNSDGTLDTLFDPVQHDGKISTDFGSSDVALSIAIQSDGKIVVAGIAYNPSGNSDFALARYNSDGSLDTTFDPVQHDGKVTTDFGGSYDNGYSVAVQPDGKIVVAGETTPSNFSYTQFALARYNPDGSLDASFDADGKVTPFIQSSNESANSVAVQPDGKIVVAGYSVGSNKDFALVRLNSNGSLDTTFDTDGRVVTPIGAFDDIAKAVAIEPDGKIVVAGQTSNGSYNDFAVVRYNSNGSLDTTFDTDAKLVTAFGATEDGARALAIQPDGKIVVAGYTYNGSNGDFAVARYDVSQLAYTENAGAVVIDNNITLSDVDSANMSSATIQIAAGANHYAEDVLSIDQGDLLGGVSASAYDSNTGTLTLTGLATKAQYESMLEHVKYTNTSDGPHTDPRTVTWTVTDNTLVNSLAQHSTITVTAVNDAPTDIALTNSSVPENQPSATTVGTFSSTDPDSSTFTYSVVSGIGSDDNASFTIVGDTLKTAAAFNFEADNSYSIRVRTVDSTGLPYEKVFTISVTDVNEAPAGSDKTITMLEDGTYTLTAADFGFSDPLDNPANVFASVKITQLETDGRLLFNGSDVNLNQVILKSDIDAGKLTFAPVADANGVAYANFKFAVMDDGGTANNGVDTDQTPNTITFNVTAVNDAPAIVPATIPAVPDVQEGVATSVFTLTGLDVDRTSTAHVNFVVEGWTVPNTGSGFRDFAEGRLSFQGGVITDGHGSYTQQFTFTPRDGDQSISLDYRFQTTSNGGSFVDSGQSLPATYSVALGDINGDGSLDVVSRGSASLALGDLNGDGKLDIVEPGQVSLGNGDGTFQSPISLVGGPSGVWSVAVGDLNGDGKLDIVEGIDGQAGKAFLGNGDGTFQNPISFPGGAFGTRTIALGDLNDDGKLDVVEGNSGQTSKVFLGNGDGTFQNPLALSDPYIYHSTIAVGDLNGDGKLDVVHGGISVGQGFVTLGTGDGTFQAPIPFGNGYFISSIALADLNGDGKLDMVEADPGGAPSRVDFGNGDGTFQTPVNLPSDSNGAWSIAVGDMNGDGWLDIVTATKVFLNNPAVEVSNDVTTTLTALNVAPALTSPISAVTIDEGSNTPVVDLTAHFNDVAADLPLTFTYVDGAGLNFGTVVDPANFVLNYGPDTNGVFTVSVVAHDKDGGSTPTSFQVTVTSVNDAPEGGDKTVTMIEDGTYGLTAADFGFSDPHDNPANAFAAVKITQLATAGSLKFNGLDVNLDQVIVKTDIDAGALKFKPGVDDNGTGYANFKFAVMDNGGTANLGVDIDQTPNTITFDVTPANDEPVALNVSATSTEDVAAPLLTAAGWNAAFQDLRDAGDGFHDDPKEIVIDSIADLHGTLTRGLNGPLVGASDTVAWFDLADLHYKSAPDFTGAASFTFKVRDFGGGADLSLNTATMSITVTAVNDAPALDISGSPFLTAINEDILSVSNGGTTVGELISRLGGTRITDPDSNPLEGIAVTGADTVHGQWEFDVGSGWQALGSPDDSHARLLAPDAKIRFVPNLDFNGGTGLAFRAWDQTGGASGGVADTSSNGGATAFSSAAETASLTVNPVHDNPVTQDISFNADEDISLALTGFFFSDAKDQVPGGSSADAQTFVTIKSLPVNGTLLHNLAPIAGTDYDVPVADVLAGNLKFLGNFNFNGSTSFQFTVKDNGGVNFESAVKTASIDVAAINDPPIADFQAAGAVGFEDNALTISGISVSDADVAEGTNQLQVTLWVDHGTLAFNDAGSLTPSGDGHDQAHALTLTGTQIEINTALANNVVYIPTANFNTDFHGPENLHFVVSDLGNTGAAPVGFINPLTSSHNFSIGVAAVNDAPTIDTFPASLSTNEDTPFQFNGISVSDVDVADGTNQLKVILWVDHGFLTFQSAGPLTPSGDGHDQAHALTLTGTPLEINTALANKANYSPAADFNTDFQGAETLHFVVDDLGNKGNAGLGLSDPQTATQTVAIAVHAINDAPQIDTFPGAGSLQTDEDTSFEIGGITVSDKDAAEAGNQIQVTVWVDHGTVGFKDAGVLIPSGDGHDQAHALILTGTQAQINAALANKLVYSPVVNFNSDFGGPDTLHFTVNDLSNSGAAPVGFTNPLHVSNNASMTIHAVNDLPDVVTPPGQGMFEDASIAVPAITVADIDLHEGTNQMQVNLKVDNGILTLSQTTGLAFVPGKVNGTSDVTFTGNPTDLNNALQTLTYTPAPNFFGADAIKVTVNDLGNFGAPGPLEVKSEIPVTVIDVPEPVTDDPNGNTYPYSQFLLNQVTELFNQALGTFTWVTNSQTGGTVLVFETEGHMFIIGSEQEFPQQPPQGLTQYGSFQAGDYGTHWIYEVGPEFQSQWAGLLSKKLNDNGYSGLYGYWQALENGEALVFNSQELDLIKLFTSPDYNPGVATLTGLPGFDDDADNGATLVFNLEEIRFADLLLA